MAEIKRAHVFFEGRVQGVFFRAYTRKWAEELGLNGWVRNLPDGRVEAVFEGEKEKIEKIIEYCKTKHPYALVTKVDIEWEEPEGIRGFRIRW